MAASPVSGRTLVVGLGNPGSQYRDTRHNVGFMIVAELARRSGIALEKTGHRAIYGTGTISGRRCILALPQTFMNLSGESVRGLLDYHGLDPAALIVAHDDLDLPSGTVRVKAGGGHGGHNGLRSIMAHLGTGDFRRVKVGIGRPGPGRDAEAWVLSTFTADERQPIGDAISRAADELERQIGGETKHTEKSVA
jgi:PTH1 family peptidyl-tRNA hydrolase